jgi:RNA polymerase sigma factor (sigma-70 family)
VLLDLLQPVLRRLKQNRRDEQAWEELYRLLWPWLLWGARRDLRTTNVADAEDLVQDVFLSLVDTIDFTLVADHPRTFLGYVRTICKRRAIDRLRRLDPMKELALSSDVLPSRSVADPLFRISLQEAATKLTPKEQALLGMVIEGNTASEMAELLSITKETTFNMLSKLRAVLRTLTGVGRRQ